MGALRRRPVILVVDDDPGVHDALELVLEDHYAVFDATDAQTALAIARSGHIDLVLLDILMPKVDGLQMLDQFHAVRPGVPVVMLSGLDRASTTAAAIRLGAVDYLTKQFDDRVLGGVLRAALQRYGALQPRDRSRALELL